MQKKNYFIRVKEKTATRFWINNVTQEEAHLAIENGASGCTQNPTYLWKLINSSEKNDLSVNLDRILKNEKDDKEVLAILQRKMVSKIAEIFLSIYEESKGKEGFVSIQGDPFDESTENLIKYARFNREAGQNIMVKIPVTKEGLEAIEVLAEECIPINATEVMSVKQALDVNDVYVRATKGIKEPAPLYFSHIAGIYDEYLKKIVEKGKIVVSSDSLWQSGISVAKKIYWILKERNSKMGFIEGGARGLHHFTEMVGADCCVTINWLGTADQLIKNDPPVIERFFQPTSFSVIDELLEKIEVYRKSYLINAIKSEEYEDFGPVAYFRKNFEEAWNSTLNFVINRRLELF